MKIINEGIVAQVLAELKLHLPPQFELDDERYAKHLPEVMQQQQHVPESHRQAIAIGRAAGEQFGPPVQQASQPAAQPQNESVQQWASWAERQAGEASGMVEKLAGTLDALDLKLADIKGHQEAVAAQYASQLHQAVADSHAGLSDVLNALQAEVAGLRSEHVAQWSALRAGVIKWLKRTALFAGIILLVLLGFELKAHAQSRVSASVSALAGTPIDGQGWDATNHAFKVNVVAGGAGGGLAQLQVGRASDGAFTNVGFGAGQLNVPVNCVVGCSAGSTTPADAFANPTTASTAFALGGVWNGTGWDRLYGDKTNGAFVNIKAATTLTVQFSAAQHVIVDSSALPSGAALDSSLSTLDTDVKSNVTLHAGGNLIGKVGLDSTTPGNTNGVTSYQPARITGTITAGGADCSVSTRCVSTSAVPGYGIATVTVNGTYAGVTANFEFSDDGGTTWYSTTCTRTDTNVQESSNVLASNKTQAWDCSVYAASNFRVRASAYTSGTVNVGITLTAAPIEAAPTVALSSGTAVTANAGTNLNTSALALESGGNLATLAGAVSAGKFNVNISSGSIGNSSFGANVADSSGNGITSNSTTTTSTRGLDMNIRSILGTAPTAAGKLDVKSADGDLTTLGTKTDAADTHTDTTAVSVISLLKEISAKLQSPSALPANQSTNVAQWGGTTVAGANPCQAVAPTALAINEATGSLTTIISGTSAKKTYICSIVLLSATAQNVNIVAGTGSNCGTTVHVGFFGGTTAATGFNFAANGGIALGNGGYVIAGGTETAADNICYTSSSTGQVSGVITYVQN